MKLLRILVTGGAGFIASHIVDTLIIQGNEVAVIDNLIHGKIENINKSAEFYKMDIRDNKITDVFNKFKPEIVIHNAAQINVSNSVKDPLEDTSINIIGSINILEACKKTGVKKIIYPASAAIFGEPEYLPIDEKHPLNMISGYGVSKHTVEHYLKVYKYLYNIDYEILRYSNVYGLRQDSSGEGGVVSIFIDKIKNNERPYIYGDGKQVRDFVYVKDVVKANLLAIKSKKSGLYNVCTESKVTINQLLEIIKKVMNSNIKPIYVSPRNGDIKYSYMTYKKINAELGWKPEYNIYDGIKDMYNYR